MRALLKTSFLIIVTSLFLVACGQDEKAKPATEKSESAQATQTAVEPEPAIEIQTPETPQPVVSETSSTTATTITTAPKPSPETTSAPVAKKLSSNHQQMLNLARKSGCLACHNVDKKIVGPAWKDVAARYKNKADARAVLTEKVSEGGRGSWTDVVGNVAMPPYFPRVSKENIESLVDFILSL